MLLNTADAVHLGTDAVDKVYAGDVQVWPGGDAPLASGTWLWQGLLPGTAPAAQSALWDTQWNQLRIRTVPQSGDTLSADLFVPGDHAVITDGAVSVRFDLTTIGTGPGHLRLGATFDTDPAALTVDAPCLVTFYR